MAGSRCVSCGRALSAEDALCPGCGSRPVALPAVGAPEVDGGVGVGEVEVPATVGSPVPARLRGEFRVERVLEDASTEADLFVVVRDVEGGGVERRVLKRYLRSQPPRPGPGVSDERRAVRVQEFEAQQARERSELRTALELLRGVADAHVIDVEDFDVDEGWELLEFVGGGTLAGLIAERVAGSVPMDEGEVLDIVEELALALVAIHAAGLSHFDIKPENVLIRSHDPLDLVLTDFGTLAPMPTSHYVHGGGMQADALYVAPERAGVTRTSKADVFAVGRIAEQMLRIGRGGGPDGDVLEAFEGEERARWELLLLGTLQRDPDLRWDAEELLAWTRGEQVRRVGVRREAVVGSELPVVAGRTPVSVADMARLIAGSPEGWRSGREHLDRGRLREWAGAERPELARALDPGGELDRIGDANLRLLEVLLWIDPELPPAYAGLSLLPESVADLHDSASGPLGRAAWGALLEHLAGAAQPVPDDRTPGPVTLDLDLTRERTAALAVDRLAAGDSIAREPLRRLIAEMAQRREELDRAVEGLGLTDIRAELRLQLLRRVAREQSGASDRAPGSLAVFRRPHHTWTVLQGCSPVVRAVLVPLVVPGRPLRDAGRWVARRTGAVLRRGDLRRATTDRSAQHRSVRPPRPRRRRSGQGVIGRALAWTRTRPYRLALVAVGVFVLGGFAHSLVLNQVFPLLTIRMPSDARISERDFVVDPAPSAFGGDAGRTNAFPDPVAPGTLEPDWVSSTDVFFYFAPVVRGDLAVVGGEGIAAFDAGSGEQRWASPSGQERLFFPPAVTADTVYVMSQRGPTLFSGSTMRLTARDAEDGRVRWRMRIARHKSGRPSSIGAPVVAEDRVFVGVDHRNSIIAVDARTGRLLWTHVEASAESPRDGRALLLSDPVVHDGRLYAVFEGARFDTSRLIVLDAETGEVIWREFPANRDAIPGRQELPVQIAAGSGMVVTTAGGAVRGYRLPRGGLHRAPIQMWTHQLATSPVQTSTFGIALTEDAVYVGLQHSRRLVAYSHAGEMLWATQSIGVNGDPSPSYGRPILPMVAGDSVFAVMPSQVDRGRVVLRRFDARSGAQQEREVTPVLPWLATGEGRLFALQEGAVIAYR